MVMLAEAMVVLEPLWTAVCHPGVDLHGDTESFKLHRKIHEECLLRSQLRTTSCDWTSLQHQLIQFC
jgi:hypothetical protein